MDLGSCLRRHGSEIRGREYFADDADRPAGRGFQSLGSSNKIQRSPRSEPHEPCDVISGDVLRSHIYVLV
jgi:hypothetical protein